MTAKFEFIDAQKANFPIVKMCVWAEVSTSGYMNGGTGRSRPQRFAASTSSCSSRRFSSIPIIPMGTVAYMPSSFVRASRSAPSSCGS